MPRNHKALEWWHKCYQIVLIAGLLSGLLLMYFYKYDFAGGWGLGSVIISVFAYFVFRYLGGYKGEEIRNTGLYLLLIPVVCGILLIGYNNSHGRVPFQNGFACAIAMFGALVYGLELIRRFSSQV